MKYTPRLPSRNVNVSSVNELADFANLALRIIGALLALYIVSGLLVDLVAPRISPKLEMKIGRLFARDYEGRPQTATEKRLQSILDRLRAGADVPALPYKVHIKHSYVPNAFAFPGGHIIVTSGLFPYIKSENSMAFVLAHELGHYCHRDHLKGLGRGLMLTVLSVVTFGADSSVSRMISDSLESTEMRFSQKQERSADAFSLDLVYSVYHNAAGGIDFLSRMEPKEMPRFMYLFASHPASFDRIRYIKERIRQKGYTRGDVIPATFVP